MNLVAHVPRNNKSVLTKSPKSGFNNYLRIDSYFSCVHAGSKYKSLDQIEDPGEIASGSLG